MRAKAWVSCRWIGYRAAFIFCSIMSATASLAAKPTFLVRDALIVDGTGSPAFRGSLRFRGDRILKIGQLTALASDRIIEAHGLVLAPGFINTHSHAVDQKGIGDADGSLETMPLALTEISQGVTTLVVGEDGRSYLPFGAGLAELARIKPAVNVASLAGHGTIRLKVMGDDYKRHATAQEIKAMSVLLAQAMREGAVGLSTGLEYNPGVYSSPDEVRELAAVAGRFGGRYVSHIRSEDRALWEAMDELIEIGRVNKMPVHISHIKLGMRDLWGQTSRLLAKLDAARAQGIELSGDVYPYDFWRTTLTALFPDRNYHDRAAAEYALAHVAPPEGIRFVFYKNDPSIVGKTLADIAAERHISPAEAMISLIVDVKTPEEYEFETMAGMSQADVDRIVAWPYANICSDGSLIDAHPRAAGTFTKILRDYVRERHLLSLEQAVEKMTSLAAHNQGLERRGLLQSGYFADLVLFDPATVADQSTIEHPDRLSVGIAKVWVNGVLAFVEGHSTEARAGRVLRHAARTSAGT
jgi:N-acyl-D-amino-acid deacylase